MLDNASTQAVEELYKVVQSHAFRTAAQSHVQKTGFAAHPSNLVKELLSLPPSALESGSD
eukprot:7086933-Alexandrium_andersonii.AAC.1